MKRSSEPIRRHGAAGFTLVELMIALGIVTIFATLGIPKAWEHTRQSVVNVEFHAIINQIERVRILEEKTLHEITERGCTSCSCRATLSSSCISDVKRFFDRIHFPDGWKSKVFNTPFMVDENEGERHWQRLGQDCVLDSIAVCDPKTQTAYLAFVPGFTCSGVSQFDEDGIGDVFQDSSTLFVCEEVIGG